MINMSMKSPSDSREAGVVSIFIVIFFMIFLSVITVGFIKVVNDDQLQSVDSDLSASALASARSGAEDGKRLLLFCSTKANTAALRSACDNALTSTQCDSLTGNATLTSALRINVDTSNGRSDGIVSSNRDFEQRYTCMNVLTLTDSVEGIQITKNTSEVIPLAGNGVFDTLRFSWHATADDRDKPLTAFRTGIDLPAEDRWNDGTSSYAAAMRMEFIWVPKGAINLNTIEASSRTVFVLPGSTNAASGVPITLNTADVRSVDPNTPGTESTPRLARCQAGLEYACEIEVRLNGLPSSATHDYFLKVSALYSSAYIKAELRNGANAVQFDGVQPIIDVTGRANDVFRRLQTRVQFNSNAFYPQYALAASELCKNMTVTDTAATSSDACNPGGLAGGSILGEAAIGSSDPNATGGSGTTNPDTRPCYERLGWSNATCFTVRPYNYSNNAPGVLASCSWTWGDGQVNTFPGTHANCQYGTRVYHTYPITAPNIRTPYTYTLTNTMVNGATYSTSKNATLPY